MPYWEKDEDLLSLLGRNRSRCHSNPSVNSPLLLSPFILHQNELRGHSAEQRLDRVSHNERKACSQRVRKDNENRRDHGWTDYSKCVEGRMARDRWSISLLSRQTISKISRTDGFSWRVLSWTRVWQACLIWPLPEGAMFCFFCLSESLPLYNNLAGFMVSETRLSYHELMKSSGWPFSSQASGPTPMAMK